jgi:hypothetical protein
MCYDKLNPSSPTMTYGKSVPSLLRELLYQEYTRPFLLVSCKIQNSEIR